MTRRGGGALLVAVAMAAPWAGCRTPSRAPAVVFPDLSPPEVLALAEAYVQDRQRLSTVVEVKGVPGLGRLGVTADVVAERPARLYVGARGFFGPPMDEIWTDGSHYLWRSQRPRAGGSGPVTPETLAALLPAPLPPSQWVGLLLGLPVPAQAPETVSACALPPARAATGCVRLVFPSQDVVELRVDVKGAVVEAVLTTGHPPVRRFLIRYREAVPWLDGLATTLQLEERLPHDRGVGQATLRLKDVQLNGPPPSPLLFAPLAEVAADLDRGKDDVQLSPTLLSP